jgi:hypothetical protein
MTLERKNPLPVGRYWVDVPSGDLPAFQQWLAERPSQIHVDGTAERLSYNWLNNLGGAFGANVTWYVFKVLSPVPWFGPGYPTIATADIVSIDDTVQRPPPEPGFLDQMLGASGSMPTVAKYAIWGGAALGAGLLVWKILDFATVVRSSRTRGRARRLKVT